MSSSAKHQLAVSAASADKQKDGLTSGIAGTSLPKELDTAGHVSEQLVKQVEVRMR